MTIARLGKRRRCPTRQERNGNAAKEYGLWPPPSVMNQQEDRT